jgi:hypothetical protein
MIAAENPVADAACAIAMSAIARPSVRSKIMILIGVLVPQARFIPVQPPYSSALHWSKADAAA